MGYLDNAKERLRDIGQGVRDVIKGRPSDPYSRKKAIAEREFRDIRDNPAPKDTSGFTPVKDSSGIVIYRGGGGRGGGGRGKERRGVGSSLAEIKAENQRIAKQKAQEEATKKAAIELAKTRTQEALRSKQLISSLRSSQQITREAKERGQGFSRTEMQRRLKELGTSTTELRQASRASKEQFRKTGISVTEQIRLEEKAKRKEVISVKDVKPSVTNFRGDNIYFSIPDNTKKPKEIYSKKLGGYVQANANGQFLDTTAIIKTPTMKERKKLEIVETGFISRAEKKTGELIEDLREVPFIKRTRERLKLKEKVEGIDFKLPEVKQKEDSKFAPTPSNVRNLFGKGSEGILIVSEKVSEQAIKRGIVKDPLLTGPSQISRETTKEVLTDVLMFSAFAPLISTGAAAKAQKTKQKLVQKEKSKKLKGTTKEEARDILESPKVEGKKITFIKSKGLSEFQTKAARSRELLRATRGEKGRTEAVKLIRETYGEDFLKEFTAQGELGFIPIVKTIPIKPVAIVTSEPTQTIKIITEAPNIVQIKRLPSTLTGVKATQSGLDVSQVGETSWITSQGVFQDSLTTQKQITRQTQDQRQIQLLGFAQDQATKQTTRQRTAQLSAFAQDQATRQETKQVQE
ncbi:MAG TPA: hypothetical protein ENH46_06260, partial [Candidatus Pacearchaeota archaeon]|nr:hypothetical protein [Candidatus Pacearchaeota archaeon]